MNNIEVRLGFEYPMHGYKGAWNWRVYDHDTKRYVRRIGVRFWCFEAYCELPC